MKLPTAQLADYGMFKPGHFYSPIPDLAQIQTQAAKIFPKSPPRQLVGIDFREKSQLKLLKRLARFAQTVPFQDEASPNRRYHFLNPSFSYGDATMLHTMIRQLKPKRIIEVGSGFSSAVTLDTNELFFANKIQCTFIEPFPELLYSLMKKGDRQRCKVIPKLLQAVEPTVFRELKSGDMLFIDSTHVSKVGSDVNKFIFQILPLLQKGVYVHFHDIFYPFEYPKEWIYKGIFWNEAYLLRAFLTYNSVFEITLFNAYLHAFHLHELGQYFPQVLKNTGASLWLRKRR